MRKRVRGTAQQIVRHREPAAAEMNVETIVDIVLRRLQGATSMTPEQMTIAELTDTVLMQPWFLPREVSNAILRLLPMTHHNKWTYAFGDWGCFKCGRKDVIHVGNGMCGTCYSLWTTRLKASIVRHAAALCPNIEDLTAQLTEKSDSARQILAQHEIIEAAKDSRH